MLTSLQRLISHVCKTGAQFIIISLIQRKFNTRTFSCARICINMYAKIFLCSQCFLTDLWLFRLKCVWIHLHVCFAEKMFLSRFEDIWVYNLISYFSHSFAGAKIAMLLLFLGNKTKTSDAHEIKPKIIGILD